MEFNNRSSMDDFSFVRLHQYIHALLMPTRRDDFFSSIEFLQISKQSDKLFRRNDNFQFSFQCFFTRDASAELKKLIKLSDFLFFCKS
jgi:hypothetical protein